MKQMDRSMSTPMGHVFRVLQYIGQVLHHWFEELIQVLPQSMGHRPYPANYDDPPSYLQQPSSCSEEQMLDHAFHVCDSDGVGKVSVTQVIDYLKSVTEPSRDGGRLQLLCRMFDPNDEGVLVDLQEFRAVMSQWIASCCQNRDVRLPLENETDIVGVQQQPSVKLRSKPSQLEGYGGHMQKYTGEQIDLTNKIADLAFMNKKLIDQRNKLQKNLESAEESNAHLAEEIAEVRCQLRSSQHAMQQTVSIRSELEDMKTFTKELEDRISILSAQKKQLEKDSLLFSSQKQSLQEENDKLLAEKEKANEALDDLCTENYKLALQLCEYEKLLLQKEELVAQKTIQLEELQTTVEEYKFLLEELKMEKCCFQEQLAQIQEDMAIRWHVSDKQCSSAGPERSVSDEVREVLEWKLFPDIGRSQTLCGIPEYASILNISMTLEDIWDEIDIMERVDGLHGISEDVTPISQLGTQLEEEGSILVLSLRCLIQMKCAWEIYASKLNEGAHRNTQDMLRPSERTRSEWTFKPEDMQLVPYCRPNEGDPFTIGVLFRIFTQADWTLVWLKTKLRSHRFIPKLLLLVLLYGLLLLPTKSGEHIWTVAAGLLWPHIKVVLFRSFLMTKFCILPFIL
ncbi:protein KASH5 isoform X2 [Hyperolius riggenbachi]|uniref:protein KASH5 isoform X2 n=1 Tax=Hyperolius riggenbachi TaxID=752182 RepID=UPI0035A3087E